MQGTRAKQTNKLVIEKITKLERNQSNLLSLKIPG